MAAARRAQRAQYQRQQAAYRAANRTEVPFLTADPARGRLLYVVQGTAADPAADGLWALDVATGRRRHLIPMALQSWWSDHYQPDQAPVLSWADTEADGTVLLATDRGLIGFDPRTDAARPIYQSLSDTLPVLSPAGPTTSPTTSPTVENDLLNGRIALSAPYAVGGGWAWSALPPLGRASLDGRTYQTLPPLRPGDADGRPVSTVRLFAGDRRLMAADGTACWVLDLSR